MSRIQTKLVLDLQIHSAVFLKSVKSGDLASGVKIYVFRLGAIPKTVGMREDDYSN